MIKTTITCDICHNIIPNDYGWEFEPTELRFKNWLSSCHPLAALVKGCHAQDCDFVSQHTCRHCSLAISDAIAAAIIARRATTKSVH